jgi:Tfp pilus assembly protein PilW
MLSLFQFILKVKPKKSQIKTREAIGGMTMIELLVGTVIAFLIITPLMGFVLGLLNDDSRESAKATTEQELQSALDFIAEDLSQAIYVYDNDGVTELKKTQLPTTGDPILVFWKRQIMRESIPAGGDNPKPSERDPKDCDNSDTTKYCNDSYVLSLVAYYLTDGNNGVCPTGNNTNCEIIRYQVHDGLKDPYASSLYPVARLKDSQKQRAAFNSLFDFSFSTPNVNVTSGAASFNTVPKTEPQVLVNYIDSTVANAANNLLLGAEQCRQSLGITATTPTEATLKISTTTNSFYACVDSRADKKVVQINLRGNALRRIQQDDAVYKPERRSYFPTASVTIRGIGGPAPEN